MLERQQTIKPQDAHYMLHSTSKNFCSFKLQIQFKLRQQGDPIKAT